MFRVLLHNQLAGDTRVGGDTLDTNRAPIMDSIEYPLLIYRPLQQNSTTARGTRGSQLPPKLPRVMVSTDKMQHGTGSVDQSLKLEK